MTKLKERAYNIYLCNRCRYFTRECYKPRMGWCSARRGAPVPVVASGREPLMKTVPCTDSRMEKRK